MSVLAFLAELLLTGTGLSVIICSIAWLAFASYRPILRQLIMFSNALLLIGATLFLFTGLYDFLAQMRSSDEYGQCALLNRATGPYWFAYWGVVLCKGGLPQLLWLKRLRRSVSIGLVLAPFLLVGYWQPFLYSSLHHDYLPASWAFRPDYRGLAVASAGYWVVFAAAWLIYRASIFVARRWQQ